MYPVPLPLLSPSSLPPPYLLPTSHLPALSAPRHLLKRWGFRRCEDICWIKTNKAGDPGLDKEARLVKRDEDSLFVHTKVRGGKGVA